MFRHDTCLENEVFKVSYNEFFLSFDFRSFKTKERNIKIILKKWTILNGTNLHETLTISLNALSLK